MAAKRVHCSVKPVSITRRYYSNEDKVRPASGIKCGVSYEKTLLINILLCQIVLRAKFSM